jgi:hypothetical protein
VNKVNSIFLAIILVITSHMASADNFRVDGLLIDYIRVVGDYSGETYDNTIELHFDSIKWPDGSMCGGNRVYIDASKAHMISAAYAAYIAGMTIDINADNSLTMRGTNCELSFIDINKI